MDAEKRHIFRIRDSQGTYYQGGVSLPRFGGTREQAWTTTDGMEAYRVCFGMPILVLAEMVNDRGEKCDVTGKRINP